MPVFRHQAEVFDSPSRNVVHVKGRRAGGTQGAVIRLVELAHQQRGSRHLWIDTVQRNIRKVVQRYFLPLLAGSRYDWHRTSGVLTFEGGSICDFGSAQRPETLEGFGYDTIWINEAGIVLWDEDLYHHTLLPMLLESPRAQMFFIGTPKGGGLFQRMYEWGQDPERADWKSFRHESWRNPALNDAELVRLREQLPERVFRQEINAEFIDEEGAVFPDPAPLLLERAPPLPAGAHLVLGVDLARLADYTVAWVGCVELGTALHCERFARLPWRQQVARLSTLARGYGNARLVVDATGVGDPICEELSAAGLSVERFVFTAQRKQQLLESLAVAMEQQRLRLVRHEATLEELRRFRYVRQGRTGPLQLTAPPGQHDDCVIALALCHWGMTHAAGGGFILGAPTRALHPDW